MIYSSPAVGPDGTIYVGSKDFYFYAITASGNMILRLFSFVNIFSIFVVWKGTAKWSYQAGSAVSSSPVVGSDGAIYVGSHDYYLYAFTPSGSGIFTLSLLCRITLSSVFLGSLKWRYLTGGYVYSSPTIGLDGTIYVGSGDSYLYAISSTGKVCWGKLSPQ